MTKTAQEIKAMFPQFASMTDALVNLHINSAEQIVCSVVFGNKYDIAICYLTAHFLTLINSAGKGDVSKVKVDAMEREYKSGKDMGEGGFGSTNYGQQYLSIKKSLTNKARRPIIGC